MLDESARLDELYALKILDTPVEERFDQYTRLVADVLDAPTVLVTLVDAQRQWFKSAIGVDAKQTSREISFCAHALPQEFLEVPDMHYDARFKDNPLVTGAPFIRFYAGAVLHGPTGQPLGTLCVLDKRPRRLSETDKIRLKTFANLVEQEINQHTRFKTWAYEIQRMAWYDAVTGLPERGLLEEHLERTLIEAGEAGQSVAVVHLHVTNFEALATLEGHRGSELVLKTITHRLQHCVRPIDQIGRLGEDRLGLILPGLDDAKDTAHRIRALVDRLTVPIEVGAAQRPVHLTAGISRFPADAATAGTLLDYARTAAGELASGRVAVHCYSKADHAHVARQYDQRHRLAEALEANTLEQVYQPILSCQGRQMIGVEALARWNDAVYGSVSPGEFVPLAEADPELCRALTRWSLIRACRQLAEWQRQGLTAPYIAINIRAANSIKTTSPIWSQRFAANTTSPPSDSCSRSPKRA